MRNKREYMQHAVVLVLAWAGLIICTAPFSTSSGLASAQADAPSWSYTGSPTWNHNGQPATLLPDGKVVVVGGPEVELYDPSTGTWSVNGTLKVPRQDYTATLLGNGKVLVAGGYDVIYDEPELTNTAELYDPATGESRFTGNSNVLRTGHTAILLHNGKVLFAGGVTYRIVGDRIEEFTTNTAELYDPATGQWSLTGNLSTARSSHTAALLQNGKVLVAGGYLMEGGQVLYTASADVYDPNTETWSSTGSLNTPRGYHTLTTLPNGNVLVSGGEGNAFPFKLNSAEIYNAATGLWSTTGTLNTARGHHTATLLSTGQVLVVGGITINTAVSNSAELYDPATGTCKTTADLNTARWGHMATLLSGGKVLVVGGADDRRAELYHPERLVPAPTPTPTATPTATPAPTPIPTPSPTLRANGKIAFTSDRDGNHEIYVMNPDGSNQVRITSNNVVDACPTWSPDGREIAFVSQKQNGSFAIFTMNADGTDRTEITALNDSYWTTWRPLSWSPDGGRIAFHDSSAVSTGIDIFVVNLDGSGRQNLTADHAHLDLTPTWSPDGSKILFSRYDLYDPPGYGGTMLHTINVDGTNLTRLANGFADGWNEDFPDWSPAVNKIVYSVNRWDFVLDLYIANPDGTGRQFFHGCDWTDNSCRLDALTPAFSPDGTKIVFSMYDFVNNISQKLYLKNLDGTGLTLLTNNGASPSWQPLLPPTACPNPIDCNESFVRQHYSDFLNRQPDADGLAFWTNEITLCGANQQCIDAKRINVSAAFFLSIEFQQTGYLVYRFYKAAYGNLPGAPVPIRLSEFLPDTQQIGQGVIVNQAGWETVLENNKQAFSAEFVQRSRFTSAYSTSLTPDQFVDQLFMNAGVTPSATDRTAAINEFGSAMTTADVSARARALRRVAENSTLAQQEFNRAFVLMQYFGYLRRNPNDPPELILDFQGYNFWLTKLNQFNGDFVNAEMVKAFISSGEYRQRFGQP